MRYSLELVKLSDWLNVVAGSGIRYVPTVFCDHMPTLRQICAALDGDDSVDVTTLRKAMNWLRANAQKGRWMARWDVCAGEDLKFKMASGSPQWDESCARLTVDDPRFVEIAMTHYGMDEGIGVCLREWVDAQVVSGFPVEMRVFFKDRQVMGVSSYYPQRPLHDGFKDEAMRAWRAAAHLLQIEACPDDGTMDFLFTSTQQMLFIEGNPLTGAHPCCFEGREVAGIALAENSP